MAIEFVADLIEEVRPQYGQDFVLRYRVRRDRGLRVDADISGWSLLWTLFADAADGAALAVKTTSGGISIVTPYADVSFAAADHATAGLAPETRYLMQLLRTDSGNAYPLTGYGILNLRRRPPLA